MRRTADGFEPFVLLSKHHERDAAGSPVTAMLMVTDIRWRDGAGKLIRQIEQSGMVDDGALDLLAEAFLAAGDALFWEVPAPMGRRPPGRPAARSAADDDDRASGTWRPGQTGVGGVEWARQSLGQRHVGGVVGREVVAQLPHAPEEPADGKPPKGEEGPPAERLPGVDLLHRPPKDLRAKRMGDLGIDQVRHGNGFDGEGSPGVTVAEQAEHGH